MDSILALLYNRNTGHTLDGMATSNITKWLIHNIPAKIGV
jgi:hypothetical protein